MAEGRERPELPDGSWTVTGYVLVRKQSGRIDKTVAIRGADGHRGRLSKSYHEWAKVNATRINKETIKKKTVDEDN